MALLELLTPQERRCLSGVAEHRQADEIAAELGIATATVERHLANVRRKLGVTSSRAAVRLMLERGEVLHTGYAAGFSSLPADVTGGDRGGLEGGRNDRTPTQHPRLVQDRLDPRDRAGSPAADDLARRGDGAGPAGGDASTQGLGGTSAGSTAGSQRPPVADGSAAANRADGLGRHRADGRAAGDAGEEAQASERTTAELEPDGPGVGDQLQRVRASPSGGPGAPEGSAEASPRTVLRSRDAALDLLDRGRAAFRAEGEAPEPDGPEGRGLNGAAVRILVILAAIGFCTFLLTTVGEFALWLQSLLFPGPGIPRVHP
ncbi:MAG: helix-turn-helix transcriptional regulator [Caulobacteraceae bacterium]|nr:helix-turn-helix transcriptional regulator [Caulobacteraceae bacterium]